MRLWTLHPRYLDPAGLVALWREALLAQAVLRGATRGYRHHPQLQRFRASENPLACIASYLSAVFDEACRRGYHFDKRKIADAGPAPQLIATTGQLEFEHAHLRAKLERRSPDYLKALDELAGLAPHPLFRLVPGSRATWEVVAAEHITPASAANPAPRKRRSPS